MRVSTVPLWPTLSRAAASAASFTTGSPWSRCSSSVAITASFSSSHSPSSPLVTVTKLLPTITAVTPRMSMSLSASGDFCSAASRFVMFTAPDDTSLRSTTYFSVLGLGVHSSWMFTDIVWVLFLPRCPSSKPPASRWQPRAHRRARPHGPQRPLLYRTIRKFRDSRD